MKKAVLILACLIVFCCLNVSAQESLNGEFSKDDFSWSKDISEVTKAVKSLLEQNLKLKAIINSSLIESDKLKLQLKGAQSEKDLLINKLNSIDVKLSSNARFKEMQASINKLTERNKKLSQDLAFAESERKVLIEDSKDLTSRLQSAQDKSSSLSQEIKILKDSYEQFKESTKELEAQLKANRR